MARASAEIFSGATGVTSPAPRCRRRSWATASPELGSCFFPPKQDGTEIVELLEDLDALQKQYDEGLQEINKVRTLLSLERKKREAVETTCLDLEREKQRLLKAQLARYERASEQLDYANKYENVLQLIKAANEKSTEHNKDKEIDRPAVDTAKVRLQEHADRMTVLREQHRAQVEDLYKQIMVLKQELGSKEQTVLTLEKKLAESLNSDEVRVKLQEAEKRVHESYQEEIEGLRKKLKAEEINNQSLQSQLEGAQLTLLVLKVNHDDQLRELSANRQADIFKQKVMKLRKDNEAARRHLQQNQHK